MDIQPIWKAVVGFSVILTIIASFLQILGAVDFWKLLFFPLLGLLTSPIPVYYALIFTAGCFWVYLIIQLVKAKAKSSILDFTDARKIALLCQQPRTTAYLREQYDYWQRQSNVVFVGGYEFNEYMKRLEDEGYLRYVNGEWHVTTEALEYINKYYGR